MARVALGVVLAASAVLKLREAGQLPGAVAAFGVPRRIATMGAVVLVGTEAALAGLLLSGLGHPWPAWAAVGLLAGFTVTVAVHLATGRRPLCPCFGVERARPVSGWTVARNGVLLALAVVATG